MIMDVSGTLLSSRSWYSNYSFSREVSSSFSSSPGNLSKIAYMLVISTVALLVTSKFIPLLTTMSLSENLSLISFHNSLFKVVVKKSWTS